MRIEHYARLLEVPPLVLAELYRAHADLLERGFTDVIKLEGDEQLFVAIGGSEVEGPVGFLAFRESDPGEVWTQLGWVAPGWRSQGVYTDMWNALVQHARLCGVVKIVGGTAFTNEKMQRLMRKLGRKPSHVMFTYDVDQSAA